MIFEEAKGSTIPKNSYSPLFFLLPCLSVKHDSHAQQYSKQNNTPRSIRPAHRVFENYGEDYREKQNRCQLVVKPKLATRHGIGVVLHFHENDMKRKMVQQEKKHETELYLHPRNLKEYRRNNKHDRRGQKSNNHGGPSDNKPKPTRHYFQLFNYSALLCIRQIACFGLIDKKAGYVKQTCKPGDHENYMKRFCCEKIRPNHGCNIKDDSSKSGQEK